MVNYSTTMKDRVTTQSRRIKDGQLIVEFHSTTGGANGTYKSLLNRTDCGLPIISIDDVVLKRFKEKDWGFIPASDNSNGNYNSTE